MPGPLVGVKVVELGVWIAGPAAGGVLADWGAEAMVRALFRRGEASILPVLS